MTIVATICDIDIPRVRHINGEGSCKELLAYYAVKERDEHGEFDSYMSVAIPVPFETPCGDRPDLIGQRIKIEIPQL